MTLENFAQIQRCGGKSQRPLEFLFGYRTGGVMKWNIQFDEPNGFLRAYQSGNFTSADQTSFLSDIFSSQFWHAGLPLMIDYCHLNVANIGYNEIATSSEFLIALNGKLGPGRIALLCDDDEQFGIGRQLQMISLIDLDREIAVFKRGREAIGWLTGPNDTRRLP